MLKLWTTSSGQTTPKASAVERNPFDANPAVADSLAGSPRTPTSAVHHHLLHAPANVSAPLTPLDLGPLTPAAASKFAAVAASLPTTHLSLNPPEFVMKQPPQPRNLPHQSRDASPASNASSVPSTTSAKGQLHVKLIQARGLHVQSSHARPYVVVQFEQNEFVSREPTSESEKEVKGVATNMSRNGSSTALSALGAISIGKAFEAAARARATTTTTPPSSFSAPRSALAPTKTSTSSAESASTSGTASPGVFGSGLSAHNPVWKHEVAFDVTSDQSMITLNVYDRRHDTEHSFLGTLQIKPVLLHDHTVDQWYKLRPFENEVVTGEIRVQVTYEQAQSKHTLTPRDFEFLKLIGRGTFGRVFQVRKKDTKRIYAMKVLSKKEIVAKKEVAHTIGERKILQRSLESPFLVGLKFSFQTDSELYLVTDFKSGGELFWHLQRETRFSEDRARFYIAELVLALEHLHKYDIVYRDLKPENILLDATGHVALCDFGLSKPDLPSDQLTNTFCGTTEYLAPEVLLDDHGYSKLVDFWSLGVLLFEMCCGWSPFYAEDTQQMYKNICFGKIRFPKGVIGEDGKLFVKGLLNRNPKHRLGAINDAAELKAHPFFKSIDWKALSLKQVTPPFRPDVESDESTTNFDPEFTSADLREHGIDDDLDEDDPSEHWVASASVTANPCGVYMPNGPLGSDHPSAAPAPPYANNNTNGTAAHCNTKAVAIEKRRKKRREAAGSPLTNSVQENFRGFTFSGESSLHQASWLAGQAAREEDGPGEGDEGGDVPDPDDVDDDEVYAGRYARRGVMDVDDRLV
ncbi:kinase-like protein [Ramaria rubella]|nr:kinase-like protein [Ramaria rubella]